MISNKRQQKQRQLLEQQQQQQFFLLQIKEPKKEEKSKEEEQEVTIIINDGVCMKESKVKHIYKISHGVFINRARRRFRKASYFSERA